MIQPLLEPLDPEVFGAASPCFGCSPHHPIGFHLRCSKETAPDGKRAVVAEFVPDDRYQGPPGVMHGGLVMTLADELAAWTVIGLVERFGFTAAMSCKLQKPVRIGIPVRGRGTTAQTGGRVVRVTIELDQGDSRAFTGDFTFALLDEAGAEKLLGGPLPDAWRRFARPRSGS